MLSVVIPTLGGNLDAVLIPLYKSTLLPDEVIVCLPNTEHDFCTSVKQHHAKIVYSGVYGQVAQRVCGFKNVSGDFVLQLDDDVSIEPTCLTHLMSSLEERVVAAAPCWYNAENGAPLHEAKRNGSMSDLYYWTINGKIGYRPGVICKAGTGIGVNPDSVQNKMEHVEWVSGGCVLHHRRNLILWNYFPYEGKSYSEDLVHSHILRKSGVQLVVNTNARCTTKKHTRIPLDAHVIYDFFIKNLYFVKMAKLSRVRMFIYHLLYILRTITEHVRIFFIAR